MAKDFRTLEIEALVKAHMPATLTVAQVEALEARIVALEAQIAAQESRIAQTVDAALRRLMERQRLRGAE